MRNNLKAIRKTSTKMTQEAAAAGLGMKLETYRKWEQGRVSLNAAQLDKLSRFYGVTIDEICGTASDITQASRGRVAAFEDELAELNVCYFNMSDEAREALLDIAHHLEELFPKEL